MPRITHRPPAPPSSPAASRPASHAQAPSRADGFEVRASSPAAAGLGREPPGSPVTRAISATLSGMINGVVGIFDRGLRAEAGPARPVGRRAPLDTGLDKDLPSWLGRITRRVDRWTNTNHPRDLVVTFPKGGLKLAEPLTLSGAGLQAGGRPVVAELTAAYKAAFSAAEQRTFSELAALEPDALGARQAELAALQARLVPLEQPLLRFEKPLIIHNPLMAQGTNLAGMVKDLAVDVHLRGLRLTWDPIARMPVAILDGDVIGRGGKKKGELRDLAQPFPLDVLDQLRETLALSMLGTTEGVVLEIEDLRLGDGEGKKLKLPTRTSDTTQLADATLAWLESARPSLTVKVKAPGASLGLAVSTLPRSPGGPMAAYELALDASAAATSVPGVLGLMTAGNAASAQSRFRIDQFLSADEVRVDYRNPAHFEDVRKPGRPWFALSGDPQQLSVNEFGRVTRARLNARGFSVEVTPIPGAQSPNPGDPNVRYPVATLKINGAEQQLAAFPSFDHIVRFLTVFDDTLAAARELESALQMQDVRAALSSGVGLIDHFEAAGLPYEGALTRLLRGQLYLQELFDQYQPPRELIDLRAPGAGVVPGEKAIAAAPQGLSFVVEGGLHGALVRRDGRGEPQMIHSYWNSLRSYLDKYQVDRLVEGQDRTDPYAATGLISQGAAHFTAIRDPGTLMMFGVSKEFVAAGVKLDPDVAEKLFDNPKTGYDYLFRLDDHPGAVSADDAPDAYCTEVVRFALREAGVKQPLTLPLEYELPEGGGNAISNAVFEALGRNPSDPLVLRQRGVLAQCFILEALIPRNVMTQVPDVKGTPLLEISRWLEVADAPMLRSMSQGLDGYVEKALANFSRDEGVTFSAADVDAFKKVARENLARATAGYTPP